MTHDSESFRRSASALPGDGSEDAEVAGHLALAYAAIERRRRAAEAAVAELAEGDDPVLLQD